MLSKEIRDSEAELSFATPDPSIVEENLERHPAPQCRLDTYSGGFLKKARPKCWFSTEPNDTINTHL